MVTPADDCPLPIPLVSGAAGFLLLLAGCNAPITGGQTGDGSGAIPEPEPMIGPVEPNRDTLGTLVADCKYDAREVDDDEATSLGFAVNDVLDFAEGSFASELTWTRDAGTGIGFRPEQEGGLSFEVRRNSSAARLLEPGDSDAGVDVGCAPLLAVGVTIEFETEGGALLETFSTELRSQTPDAATFSAMIRAADLEGALELDGAPADVSLDSVLITGVVSPLGTAGSVQAVLDYGGSETEGEGVDPLFGGTPAAYWPSQTCSEAAAYGQPGIVVDDDVEVAGRNFTELVDALEAFSPVDLTWSDGRESALRLQLVPTRACAVDQGGVLRLRGDVEVSFATDDGALSGTLPGTLSDDGVVGEEAWTSLNSSAFMPTDEFLEAVTLDGITVDGYEEVSFNLFLGGSGSATGGLSITGTERCEGVPDAPDAVAECFSPLFEAGLGELEPIDGSAAK